MDDVRGVGHVVARADFRASTSQGIVRSASKAIAAWPWTQGGGGLLVESVRGAGPVAAAIVSSEGAFSDVEIDLDVVLTPPWSQLALKVRQGDAGNYNFRVHYDGGIGLERLIYGPTGPQLSWLAQSTLANFAPPRRLRPTAVRASALGPRLTMHVDGRLVLTVDDHAIKSGRVTVAMTVVPEQPSSVVLGSIEVRAL